MSLADKVIAQNNIENLYNRKHIEERIREFVIYDRDIQDAIEEGVELVHKFINGTYYQSKMDRIVELKVLNIYTLVAEIVIGTAYFQRPELFTSVVPQIASRLQFSDRIDSIRTVSELLAVLCETDLFDITKKSDQASLMLVSNIELDEELVRFIECSQILPPMICKPLKLVDNYSSGYLTHKESLLLGSNNYHNDDICLDVLNIMNSVCLKLDAKFIEYVPEEPTFTLDTGDKVRDWNNFVNQSEIFYKLLIDNDNKFYLTHKVDSRGRIYAHAYHVNTMGTAYKKASLEFYKEEIVTGI